MTIADALRIRSDYFMNDNPTEEEEFLYTEALDLLINETKKPAYMTELGWFYCERKRFDLELKYLEMAAEFGDMDAMEELGYMYYYGQHGEKDYAKAYECFKKGVQSGNEVSKHWCRYKIADMYHYGYHVEKDEKKYRELIETLYNEIQSPDYLNEPFPEVSLRLAEIKIGEGDTDEAEYLLQKAKDFLAERLQAGSFWGHIEVMERIIKDLYQIKPFPEDDPDFYDLFHISDRPATITFRHGLIHPREYTMEISDDTDRGIKFNDKWYRSFNELCDRGELEGRKITAIYDELYDFAVEEEEVAS